MIKIIISSLILITTSIASAHHNNQFICDRVDSTYGGTLFYYTFFTLDKKESKKIKQPYTYVYKKVDKVLNQELKQKCGGLSIDEAKRLTNQHAQTCNNTCSEVAVEFHAKRRFPKRKTARLTKECQSICEKARKESLKAI